MLDITVQDSFSADNMIPAVDMANTNLFNLLPRHIAADYSKLKSITSKLQRTASSIAFIKKALHHNLAPTFAKAQGQFVNNKDKTRAEELMLKSNLVEHKRKS